MESEGSPPMLPEEREIWKGVSFGDPFMLRDGRGGEKEDSSGLPEG